jgi:hypothetical protein
MDKQTIIIISNILIIISLSIVGLYLYFNLDEARALMSDPCRACEEKTGGICANLQTLHPKDNLPENINSTQNREYIE